MPNAQLEQIPHSLLRSNHSFPFFMDRHPFPSTVAFDAPDSVRGPWRRTPCAPSHGVQPCALLSQTSGSAFLPLPALRPTQGAAGVLLAGLRRARVRCAEPSVSVSRLPRPLRPPTPALHPLQAPPCAQGVSLLWAWGSVRGGLGAARTCSGPQVACCL